MKKINFKFKLNFNLLPWVQKGIVVLSICILLITIILTRYYIATEPDESKLINPITSLTIDEDPLAKFVDQFEELVPPIVLYPEEFKKESLFE